MPLIRRGHAVCLRRNAALKADARKQDKTGASGGLDAGAKTLASHDASAGQQVGRLRNNLSDLSGHEKNRLVREHDAIK